MPGTPQITLLLSMSVSLLLLPWASRHPTFWFGLPLLAVTPVVGQGVRPLLREAFASLLRGLRLSSNFLLPHQDDAAHVNGHGHGQGQGHHGHGHGHGHQSHGHGHGHHSHGAAGSAARKVVDPRTGPHGPAAAPPYAEPFIQPSGPYSEWRPPAERAQARAAAGDGGGGSPSGSPSGSPGASALSSRDGSFRERHGSSASQPLSPQHHHHQQQQQPHHNRPNHSHHQLHTVPSQDNLESLEEEEEAMWAAAAASLEQQQWGLPEQQPLDMSASAGQAWHMRDPRVLPREQKVQRLSSQQRSAAPGPELG